MYDAARRSQEGEAERLASVAFDIRLAQGQALDAAVHGLWRAHPELSARGGLSAGQSAGLAAVLGCALVVLATAQEALIATAITATTLVFSLIIAFRIAATLAAAVRPIRTPDLAPEQETPSLTLLVPLLREKEVVGDLIRSLEAIDYPRDRLEVKLLVEADDAETLSVLHPTSLPRGFEILPVPPGEPRTKPKALNFGLAQSTGEIVAIFDAEDRPAPGQAREAAAAFMRGGPDLAVVQAPLRIHNVEASWISGQFALEYAIQFNILLPLVARLGWPMPLGGTSNYVRRSWLERAHGWDAWNVTEDADLGVRLARLGGRAAMISEPTWEEAPSRLSHWMAQRTRWQKGHLQTWGVLMRRPLGAIRNLGFIPFLGLHLVLGGGLFASLLHLPLAAAAAVSLAFDPSGVPAGYAALFGLGYASTLGAAFIAGGGLAQPLRLATLPLYWPLLTIALVLALSELRRRPHFWAKTPHGITPGARRRSAA
jgi:glycosyltransferase XagB